MQSDIDGRIYGIDGSIEDRAASLFILSHHGRTFVKCGFSMRESVGF